MEKNKEMTLKQRLQNLSEEPTPFFHSLTPFAAGALFFHEKNLKSKVVDLVLVFIGMVFLYLGTK